MRTPHENPEISTDPAFAATVYKANAVAGMLDRSSLADNSTDRTTFNTISKYIDQSLPTGGRLKKSWDTPIEVLNGMEKRIALQELSPFCLSEHA